MSINDSASLPVNRPSPQAIIQQRVEPPRSQRELSQDELHLIMKNRATIDWIPVYAEWLRDEVLNRCTPVISGEGRIEQWVCPSPSHREEKAYFRISYDKDTEAGIPQCSCNIQDVRDQWGKVGEWVGAIGFLEWLHDRLVKKGHSPAA